jgi:uncharacterized membrane protein YfcA
MKNKIIVSKIVTIIYILIGIISPLVFVKVALIDGEGFKWYWLLLILFFLSYFFYNSRDKEEQDSELSLANKKTATMAVVLSIVSVIISILWVFIK